jgi:hypothetical protein
MVRLAARQIAIYPSLSFHFGSLPTVFLSSIAERATRFSSKAIEPSRVRMKNARERSTGPVLAASGYNYSRLSGGEYFIFVHNAFMKITT